jgi:hypothetical protein
LLAYLGAANAINGPINYNSKLINCVVASVAEAALAGGFQAAQITVHFRRSRILHDLGYLQPPTLLSMDNTVAIGIATKIIKAKRSKSKSMGMRFFSIIDCVRQKQFVIEHVSGQWNIADHFTKPLPRAKFLQFLQYLSVNMDDEPSETYRYR